MMSPPIFDLASPKLLKAIMDRLQRDGQELGDRRPEPPNMPPITNGGYRFPLFSDFEQLFWYNEYWYFGFHDNRTGLTGMAAYGVVNPGSKTLGRGLFSVALFEPGAARPYRAMDLFPMKKFKASTERAQLEIGPNTVIADANEVHRIRGATADGALQLALQFEPVNDQGPYLAGRHLPGPLNWEWDSWILALPGARVTGQVVLHGAVHELTHGGGYHDHSWGVWLLPERIWAWATASDPERDIHIIAGYKCGFAVSTILLQVGERRFFFDSSVHTSMRWTADSWVDPPGFKPPYPTRAQVTVEDLGIRLTCSWQAHTTVCLEKSPICLYEQAATLDIRVTGELDVDVTGLVGHAQFITRWFRPTPIGESLGED